jgi:two-component sensor histidine kinase
MDHDISIEIIENEIDSNTHKYAFPEDGEGEIKIKLCREKENNKTHKSLFSLTISDNGKGIPEDLKLENLESLGLRLVTLLVEQVDGKIELKRGQGTEFRITFEVTENLC